MNPEEVPLEEAVARPGRKVQVLGKEARNGEVAILIYTIADDGAKLVAGRYVPSAERPALVASFEARGVPVAESDFHTNLLWLRHADGIVVYDDTSKLLDAAGDRATLADGMMVERAEIMQVIAFASDDYIHRGVTAALTSGTQLELVKEISLAAMGDPTYSRNELLFETSGWLPALASAIAAWARVGFIDKI
jgi:hypothetical protein